MPPKSNLARMLAIQGLLDADVADAVSRLEAMQAGGGTVARGEPLSLDELMAIADVTPEDAARAGADWQISTPAWARGLLDAKAVDGL